MHQITEKLNDKNFLLWRQQIKPAITALGLNCFVANPQIPPRYLSDANHDLDHVNPLFLMWQKQDKFMLVWLQFTLSSSILARVLRSTHLYQVWDKIHAYFHHQTRTKARQLRSVLHVTPYPTLIKSSITVLYVKSFIPQELIITKLSNNFCENERAAN